MLIYFFSFEDIKSESRCLSFGLYKIEKEICLPKELRLRTTVIDIETIPIVNFGRLFVFSSYLEMSLKNQTNI